MSHYMWYFTDMLLVHPCDKETKGGCNQICNKRKEWYECSCESGFVLGKDKKICNKGECFPKFVWLSVFLH